MNRCPYQEVGQLLVTNFKTRSEKLLTRMSRFPTSARGLLRAI
jgi:hypothetical protein